MNYKNSHIGHYTHTAGSANVQYKYKTFHGRYNITCSTNCKYRRAATLYTLETWFISDTVYNSKYRDTRGRSWLRHCATSWKVEGSTRSFLPHYGPGFDSASDGLSFGIKGGRYGRMTTLQPSCAHCLEILGPSTSCSPNWPVVG